MTSNQLGHLKSSWTNQNDILDQDRHIGVIIKWDILCYLIDQNNY
jgi:hypothetical protein